MTDGWYRLDIRTSHCAADLVTQLLVALGSRGSMVTADGDWSVVSGFVPRDGRAEAWRTEAELRLDLAKQYGLCRPDSAVTVSELADQDWAENWKEFFEPFEVGEKFRIVPPWMVDAEDRGSRIEDRTTTPLQSSILNHRSSIVIEPGMAFGTGQHATTVLCLELLEVAVRPGMTVIDVGAGTGILGIGAALLGASRVIAIDSDPLCPPAVRKNATLNAVQDRVIAVQSDLLSCVRIRADLIVANLTSYGIVSLCPHVQDYLRADGIFIASGIPSEKADEVMQALPSSFVNPPSSIREREGWVAFATRLRTE